jgi:hypothetical protein
MINSKPNNSLSIMHPDFDGVSNTAEARVTKRTSLSGEIKKKIEILTLLT